ncbi:hypothetical protein DSL72_006989 [Monilinia vaccinii-corymbosi]|uniref:Uncharacterized protein n=1 Tax=Monilinia vaccinii-corymbosi TaxID=61207 RepID=A0A8A3PKD8_9HELO|nr:hypothetical protein DSL72_006989 [Monilinia vaccinii-corymbosi]
MLANDHIPTANGQSSRSAAHGAHQDDVSSKKDTNGSPPSVPAGSRTSIAKGAKIFKFDPLPCGRIECQARDTCKSRCEYYAVYACNCVEMKGFGEPRERMTCHPSALKPDAFIRFDDKENMVVSVTGGFYLGCGEQFHRLVPSWAPTTTALPLAPQATAPSIHVRPPPPHHQESHPQLDRPPMPTTSSYYRTSDDPNVYVRLAPEATAPPTRAQHHPGASPDSGSSSRGMMANGRDGSGGDGVRFQPSEERDWGRGRRPQERQFQDRESQIRESQAREPQEATYDANRARREEGGRDRISPEATPREPNTSPARREGKGKGKEGEKERVRQPEASNRTSGSKPPKQVEQPNNQDKDKPSSSTGTARPPSSYRASRPSSIGVTRSSSSHRRSRSSPISAAESSHRHSHSHSRSESRRRDDNPRYVLLWENKAEDKSEEHSGRRKSTR